MHIARATSYFSTAIEAICAHWFAKTTLQMAKAKARGFTRGEKSRAGQAKAKEKLWAEHMRAECGAGDAAIDDDEEEPQLAQPN